MVKEDKAQIKARLEYLREQIEEECISYGEIAELESLADEIEPGDILLLEWAGVSENSNLNGGELVGGLRQRKTQSF